MDEQLKQKICEHLEKQQNLLDRAFKTIDKLEAMNKELTLAIEQEREEKELLRLVLLSDLFSNDCVGC